MTERSVTPPELSASDRLARHIKHHGSAHPHLTSSGFTATGALISDYAPQMVTPRWVDIHDFTHRCVAEMATPGDEFDRQAYLSATSRLVHWATGYGSLPLERQEIFHPDTISDFMHTAGNDSRHEIRNHRLGLLTQMSETLVHAADNQVPPPGYGMTGITPFAAADFQELADWADGLTPPRRRRDADATLAFCLGAGLSWDELFNARVQDVVFRSDGVFIFVPGEFPRSVPVHSLWEDRARSRFEGVAPRAHLVLAGTPRGRRQPTWVTPGRRNEAFDAAQFSARLGATWLERTEDLLAPVAAAHFSGDAVPGGPSAAHELVKTIDFETSVAILRGAGEGW